MCERFLRDAKFREKIKGQNCFGTFFTHSHTFSTLSHFFRIFPQGHFFKIKVILKRRKKKKDQTILHVSCLHVLSSKKCLRFGLSLRFWPAMRVAAMASR